jgi:hypothetical protein
MGRGDYAAAAEEFEKAVQMNPSHPQAAIRVRQAFKKASSFAQRATGDTTTGKKGKQ